MSLTIELNSVLLTGPTLASVFQAIALSQMEFDGLLLGRVGSRVVSRMVDLTGAHTCVYGCVYAPGLQNVVHSKTGYVCSFLQMLTYPTCMRLLCQASAVAVMSKLSTTRMEWLTVCTRSHHLNICIIACKYRFPGLS